MLYPLILRYDYEITLERILSPDLPVLYMSEPVQGSS